MICLWGLCAFACNSPKISMRSNALKRKEEENLTKTVSNFNHTSLINVEKEVLEKGKHLKFSCGLTVCGRSEKKQALTAQNQDEILINILKRSISIFSLMN